MTQRDPIEADLQERRVIFCGSRDWADEGPILSELMLLMQMEEKFSVAHGAARGADTIAARGCKAYGIPVKSYPADWKKHGVKAGPIRNLQMLRDFKPTDVIGYTDDFDNRRSGTRHMCVQAYKAGVHVTVVHHGIGGCYSYDLDDSDL